MGMDMGYEKKIRSKLKDLTAFGRTINNKFIIKRIAEEIENMCIAQGKKQEMERAFRIAEKLKHDIKITKMGCSNNTKGLLEQQAIGINNLLSEIEKEGKQ